ncbi:MAG: CoA transferase [Caulobacter sp.]
METGAVGAGPLSGIKVLDLTAVVSGPFATMWLADQGAEVTKIEAPDKGDQGRYVGAGFLGYSALFATCNRNKRSIALDLRTEEGIEIAFKLAAGCDVLLENFRPGVTERLGLGYEAVRAVNPRVIYASISGYGPEGPYTGRKAYDSLIQSISGLADVQGGGGEPRLINTILCDKVAGLTAAQAITAALFARGRDGKGRQVWVSMLEAALAFNWPDVMWNETFLSESFQPGLSIADTYRLWKTRDGHVAVVFISPTAFHDWCAALDVTCEIAAERFETEAASRLRWLELQDLWESRIAMFDTDDVVRRFHAHGVPAGPVLRRQQVAGDAQVIHDRSVVRTEHARHGPMQMSAPAARFSDFAPPPPRPAPDLGQQSIAILEEIGLGEAAAGLVARGVVRTPSA